MSLVAYGSSDSDSDSDDKPVSRSTESKVGGGLFSTLPPPKRAPQQSANRGASLESNFSTKDNASENPTPGLLKKPQGNVETKGLLFDLPKPKKRTEPVKITVPDLKTADSDSDEDEPVRKRKVQPQGTGLSGLLPQPKNLVVKETNRQLVPHSLTKQAAPPASRTQAANPPKSLSGSTNASPSAIKAAAKSAAMQLARQMAADEEGSDEELAPENYFSLGESSQPPLLVPKDDALPSGLPPPPGTENAPLQFGARLPGVSGEGADLGVQQQEAGYQQYQDPCGEPGAEPSSEGYFPGGYYPDDEPEQGGSSSLFDDEAFRRLQGKRNQGKEEVKFLEIRGDDQLSGAQNWMTKNISEEKEQRSSFSKKKGGQPTGQQRRKHQITYLIHQAKERELELKNSWADNKLSRRQTQAKYGF
ncbi:hypothetical protein ACEWY4_023937 [Coilia grayii]|uniref:Proline-rich protein PRCC n=1 Tax=Coilia grayii TaxID=363190 RepID=A0ABD1IYZ6_9TELE